MCGWFSAAAARASRTSRRAGRRIIGGRRRQDFDRDDAVELLVVRAVDLAHPAGARAWRECDSGQSARRTRIRQRAMSRPDRTSRPPQVRRQRAVSQVRFDVAPELVVAGAGLRQEGDAIGSAKRLGVAHNPRDLLAAIHGQAESTAVLSLYAADDTHAKPRLHTRLMPNVYSRDSGARHREPSTRSDRRCCSRGWLGNQTSSFALRATGDILRLLVA